MRKAQRKTRRSARSVTAGLPEGRRGWWHWTGGTVSARRRQRDAMAQDSKPKVGGTWLCGVGRSAALIRILRPGGHASVVHQAYNGLVKFTPDGTTIVSDLAESGNKRMI